MTDAEKIAVDEFDRQIKIIEDATNDKALSETGRASIVAIADSAALTAQRIASRIRARAATPAVGGEREALIHALVRFQCLADHFKEVGEDALWAMSEVDGDRMKKALGRHGQFHHVTQDEKDMCTICAAPPASPLRGREAREVLRSMCKAGGDLGCSCADQNYQWWGGSCQARMAEAFKHLLSASPPEQPAATAHPETDAEYRNRIESVIATTFPEYFPEHIAFEAIKVAIGAELDKIGRLHNVERKIGRW